MAQQYVFFWGNKDYLSNFYQPATFVLGGVEYNCSEQYFMACKAIMFGDYKTMAKIMDTNSPKEQKALGREVIGFDKDLWDRVSYNVMFRGCMGKFSQNLELKTKLLSEEGQFVEASPWDCLWGVGLRASDPKILDTRNWRGLNRLGKVLDEVRDVLERV